VSSNLVWEPYNRKTTTLDDALKFALRKRCGGMVDTVMHGRDVPYLEGLRDAGVKGAAELIAAIEKHDDVVVREEY
jgi:hypothetical protein